MNKGKQQGDDNEQGFLPDYLVPVLDKAPVHPIEFVEVQTETGVHIVAGKIVGPVIGIGNQEVVGAGMNGERNR